MKIATKERMRPYIPNIAMIKVGIQRIRLWRLYHKLIPLTSINEVVDGTRNKREVVDEWEQKRPLLSSQLNQEIDGILLKNKWLAEKPNLKEYLIDLKYYNYAYGYLPFEYICYEFENKSVDQRHKFISDLERIKLIFQLNDFIDNALFMDKARTFIEFSDYYYRECIVIEKQADYSKFQEYVCRHSQYVKKPAFESIGNGVALIDMSTDKRSDKELFNDFIKGGKHILEERIVQSSVMARFNKTSVNTVRCITVRTNRGVVIPWAFCVIGREGSFVNNGGAGGILVGVDIETGKTCTSGVDEYTVRYTKHPDSKMTLEGIQLPDWEQLKKTCIEMAQRVERIRLIGWDLAHTEEHGWIVVEGNGASQFVGPQCTFVAGMRDSLNEYMEGMALFV